MFDNNKNIYIYPLSHSYLNLNGASPLTLKFMPGPRDNGCYLMEMHVFGIMAVTVDLQGVLTICTRVGFGRGGLL